MLFTNQALAYAAAPGANGVYEQRARLETLVNGSRQARKYIIATTNTPDILIYNLEDKVRPDLLDQLSAPPRSNMKRSPLTIAVAFVLIVIFGLLLFVYQVRKSRSRGRHLVRQSGSCEGHARARLPSALAD